MNGRAIIDPAVTDNKYAFKIAKKVSDEYKQIEKSGGRGERTRIMVRADAPDPRQRNEHGEVRRGKPTMSR